MFKNPSWSEFKNKAWSPDNIYAPCLQGRKSSFMNKTSFDLTDWWLNEAVYVFDHREKDNYKEIGETY